MTKEITKAYILQQVQDKFKLRELEPEVFRFSEMVVPVYDIGQHLTKHEVKDQNCSITAGSIGRSYFLVPTTEKWFLHFYNVIFKTGVFTVAGLMIYRPSITEYIYVDLKAGQSASYLNFLPTPVVLNPGDLILLYIDGYTSTGDLELRIDVTVEEVR